MVMRLRLESPDWTAAKCTSFQVDRNHDMWFGDDQGLPLLGLMDDASAVCNGRKDNLVCPLRHQCLVFSLINNEAWGVWGGMLPDDRKYVRNHIDKEDWIWTPPLPEPLKEHGAALRARKSRVA